MAKHTPGPWEAVYSTVYGADGFQVVDADQGPHLRRDFDSETEGHWGTAPNSHVERDAGETDANARLIAAAPTMLEALHQIDALDPEQALMGGVAADAARGLVLRMGEIARAAIAKAGG